jgi:release factor glutamine methyltransferase
VSSSSRSSDPTGEPLAGGPLDVERAQRLLTDRLRSRGIDSASAEAGALLEAVTGLTRSEQVLSRRRRLEAGEVTRLESLLRRREAREPLQLVLGETEFCGVRLRLRPGVLVPRPETERLVELALTEAPASGPYQVLDVGTGSGAVALAILRARPGTRVTATDVDPAAVALARENAAALSLPLETVESDLLAASAARAAAAEADLLVANLPYLPERDRLRAPPELAWDPPQALYAGRDGLDAARRLLAEAGPLLRDGAVVWLELDPRNAGTLLAEAADGPWTEGRLAQDLNRRERFVRLRRARR